MLGIGGGGDIVGAIAVAHNLRAAGVEAVLGGVAWERRPVDPHPGPRPLAQIQGVTALERGAAIVAPGQAATTPEGAEFCESRVAAHRGERTVLIDVSAGPAEAAAGIEAAAGALDCDLVFLVDIGGDAIADGSEPGLASPLCDAVMIAAGASLATPCLLGVLGAGCDGELQPAEVSARIAALARAGAWLGTLGVSPGAAAEIEATAQVALTEASLLVAHAARGVEGAVEIRGGRRTVDLGPIAALTFVFDPQLAADELPLVRAVRGVESIAAGRDALNELGVHTELDYEERNAGA